MSIAKVMAIASPGASTQAASGSVLALAELADARRATLELVAHLDDRTLGRSLSSIMSPLVWDLAHIAAYEDLWLCHRHGGLELARPELAERYDAFETPRSVRGNIELLDAAGARDYLDDVRKRTVAVIERLGVGDGTIFELVLRHELQHSETMRQTMALADLLPAGEPRLRPFERPSGADEFIQLEAGSFQMGATDEGFTYDNERPRHSVQSAAYEISRLPVSNGQWRRFTAEGGYERSEYWSPEGWRYLREQQLGPHPAIEERHPDEPVCHVSWFEADAFARWSGARLPSEAEWERAAAAEQPLLEGTGQVWEWTSTRFDGYPGFVAHPYREYSEVFFGDHYLVLRGGSWATHPRVASATFRNWDYPQRRQIFSGLRLARDPG